MTFFDTLIEKIMENGIINDLFENLFKDRIYEFINKSDYILEFKLNFFFDILDNSINENIFKEYCKKEEIILKGYLKKNKENFIPNLSINDLRKEKKFEEIINKINNIDKFSNQNKIWDLFEEPLKKYFIEIENFSNKNHENDIKDLYNYYNSIFNKSNSLNKLKEIFNYNKNNNYNKFCGRRIFNEEEYEIDRLYYSENNLFLFEYKLLNNDFYDENNNNHIKNIIQLLRCIYLASKEFNIKNCICVLFYVKENEEGKIEPKIYIKEIEDKDLEIIEQMITFKKELKNKGEKSNKNEDILVKKYNEILKEINYIPCFNIILS